MLVSMLILALSPQAQAHAPAKPQPAWISIGPRGEKPGSNAEVLAAIKAMFAKTPKCRDFNPAEGTAKAEGWLLCRGDAGWKEVDPAKRAPLKKKLTETFGKTWTLSFSDGVRYTAPDEKERRRKAVERAGKPAKENPHGAVVAKFAGADDDLRDGLGAMVSLQSRSYGSRNPAGISRLHGRVKGPEDSIRIGARIWKDYRSTLERRNGDLFEKYKGKGEAALLVALAYRYGPGRVLRWAKGAALSLPKEAQGFANLYLSKFGEAKGAITRSIGVAPAQAQEIPIPRKRPRRQSASVPIPVRRPAREANAALARSLTPARRVQPVPIPKARPVRSPARAIRTPKSEPLPVSASARGQAGKLNLRNLASGERIAISYDGGSLNAADQKAFNRVMRDKSGRSTKMSPKLLAILSKIQARYPGKTISIVSGYRSPEYNAALRRASIKRNGGKSGVAKNSRHTHADAADIIVEGVSVKALNTFARSLKMGGVGHYPGQWVHVDAGRVRYW